MSIYFNKENVEGIIMTFYLFHNNQNPLLTWHRSELGVSQKNIVLQEEKVTMVEYTFFTNLKCKGKKCIPNRIPDFVGGTL